MKLFICKKIKREKQFESGTDISGEFVKTINSGRGEQMLYFYPLGIPMNYTQVQKIKDSPERI